jgi:hypothetical protein
MHTVKLNREWHSCEVCDAPEDPAAKPDIVMLMRQAEEFYTHLTNAAASIGRPRKH